jgi:hypothetical protein
MKPLNLNGLLQPALTRRQRERRLNANTRRRRSSALSNRRAKRLATNILISAFVAVALITTGAALHQEQRLQMMEAGR